MSKAAHEVIAKHMKKEALEVDPYKKGWHRGYWEGVKDCLSIEGRERNRTPEWLAEVLNSDDGNYKP